MQLALSIPALSVGRDMIRFVYSHDTALLREREQRWETMILTHWNQYNSLTTGNLLALVKEETARLHLRVSLQRRFFNCFEKHVLGQGLLRQTVANSRDDEASHPTGSPPLVSMDLRPDMSQIDTSPVTPQKLIYPMGAADTVDMANITQSSPAAASTLATVRDRFLLASGRVYTTVSPRVELVFNTVSPRVESVLHNVSPQVESVLHTLSPHLNSITSYVNTSFNSFFRDSPLRPSQRERESGDGSAIQSSELATRPQDQGSASSQPLN